MKITVITCESGDWEALYINGKFTGKEGHGLEIDDVIYSLNDLLKQGKQLGNGPYEHTRPEITDDAMGELCWNFPENIEDIPKEAYTNYKEI